VTFLKEESLYFHDFDSVLKYRRRTFLKDTEKYNGIKRISSFLLIIIIFWVKIILKRSHNIKAKQF
jgi:hypothetical protein